MAESIHPDLILMDIKLPKQDGYAATRQIREVPENSDVPVIALTAHAMTEDEDKALRAGCDSYHAKPVSFSQLVRQMEELLENGRKATKA
jgi:CheY-like chemotaxis protein